jgi:hypothetical protein
VVVVVVRNTHLDRSIEWVFGDSFDAHNAVDDLLCFFEIFGDPFLGALLGLLVLLLLRLLVVLMVVVKLLTKCFDFSVKIGGLGH